MQLEIKNKVEVIKYHEGQSIVFKTKDFNDTWQKQTIVSFKPEENLILFKRGMVAVEDIIAIRRYNMIAGVFAKMLYTYTTVASLYTIVDIIRRPNNFDLKQALFVGMPALLGVVLDKLVSYKVYHLGDVARLRILDVSW